MSDLLFKDAFVPESLCAPDLTGIFGPSLRSLMNNPG